MVSGFCKDDFFNVISVDPYAGGAEQLPFEREEIVQPTEDHEAINWLLKLRKDESIEEHFDDGKNLEPWKQYLEWRSNIVKAELYGIKFLTRCVYQCGGKSENTVKDMGLAFFVVAESKDKFDEFKKYFRREICVYENSISNSENKIGFDILDSPGLPTARSCPIGDFKRIEEEGSLKDKFPQYDEHSKILEENPAAYGAIVTYDLSKKFCPSEKQIKDLNKENKNVYEFIKDYAQKIIDGKEGIPSEGFLTLNAVGDFALIRRLQSAINAFERDESANPTLKNWLFDITKAGRAPDWERVEIKNYLNDFVRENEYQRTALKKILSAPDVALVQGPPGTGKTALIAEAIYQFVLKGKKVLLASQSNDAVDNALGRLGDAPEIRAVRLDSRYNETSDEDDDEEDDGKKVSKEEIALSKFYDSLSSRADEKFLSPWKEIDKDELGNRIRRVKNAQKDIIEFFKLNRELGDEHSEIQKELEEVKKKIGELKIIEADQQQEIKNLEKLKSALENDSDDPFYLSEENKERFDKLISSQIEDLKSQGILVRSKDAASFITQVSSSLRFTEQILLCGLSCDDESTAECNSVRQELLEIKKKERDEQDENNFKKLEKREKELKKELNRLKPAISVPKEFFTDEISERLKSGDKETAEDVKNVFLAVKNKLAETADECCSLIQKRITETSDELAELENQRKKVSGKEAAKNSEVKEMQKKLKDRQDNFKVHSDVPVNFEFGEDADSITENTEKIVKDLESRKRNFESESKSLIEDRIWENSLLKLKEKLDDKEQREFDFADKNFYAAFKKSSNVVGVSCTINPRKFAEDGFIEFDVVIIDEVSKATPVELLIPLMRAKKVILVGDHRQLPPMFKEHEQSYKDLFNLAEKEEETTQSDEMPNAVQAVMTVENFRKFKNMVTSSLFKEYFESADDSIRASLFTQYRMHNDICSVINRFYEDKLENGYSLEEADKKKKHDLKIPGADGSDFIVPENHAYWLDSSEFEGSPCYETFRQDSTSAVNLLEQQMILQLLKKIAAEYKRPERAKNPVTVGVISFYQRQVNELRKKIRELKEKEDLSALEIDTNTVDRFQGQEKNIIITSLVRNNSRGKGSKHIATFERINVAFSRAQNLLFIIGAKSFYETQEVVLPKMDGKGSRTAYVYKNIISDLSCKGCFFKPEKLFNKGERLSVKSQCEENAKEI